MFEEPYRQRRFCPTCFTNGNLGPECNRCGDDTLEMDYDAQPPRKRASKMRWREFFNEWYPNLPFDRIWWTRERIWK